jgi:hypothetical protein
MSTGPPTRRCTTPRARSPGLFAEEYVVIQRQLRGNLPQAFAHALLLEATRRLGEAGVDSRGFEAAVERRHRQFDYPDATV